MRLIDADKASLYLKNLFKGYISGGEQKVDAVDASYMVQCVIRDTPTVDAEPVRPAAYWVQSEHGEYTCSACNADASMDYRGVHCVCSKYCRECGAKMDESGNDDR